MDYFRCVIITGDLSSIVDKPSQTESWVQEVVQEICEQKPTFAAVHIQGLSTTEGQTGEEYARKLHSQIIGQTNIAKLFHTSKSFFDVKQTGLGCVYLFGDDERNAQIISRRSRQPQTLIKKHDLDIGGCDTNEHIGGAELPEQEENMNGESSSQNDMAVAQTGYLLSEWVLCGKHINMVNLCLHQQRQVLTGNLEKTNFATSAATRKRQFESVLNWLASQGSNKESLVLAGAFNSQLQEGALMEDLATVQHASVKEIRASTGAPIGIEHSNDAGNPLLTVRTNADAAMSNGVADDGSRFDMHDNHDWFFKLGRGQMVKKYNSELDAFKTDGRLSEETIYFHPSRSFGFDRTGEYFLRNRCPAWADRILFNKAFNDIMKYDAFSASGLYYGLVGQQKDIGMFKPVALHATLSTKTRDVDRLDEMMEDFVKKLRQTAEEKGETV